MKNQIKINLKSFDHTLLDQATKEIVSVLKRAFAKLKGPVPLPRRIQRFTVNRSPHVHIKSREQYEIRTQKRLLVIEDPNQAVVEALSKVDLAAGVDVMIELENEE